MIDVLLLLVPWLETESSHLAYQIKQNKLGYKLMKPVFMRTKLNSQHFNNLIPDFRAQVYAFLKPLQMD